MIRKIKHLSACGQVFLHVESEADSTEASPRAPDAPKGAGFRFRHVFWPPQAWDPFLAIIRKLQHLFAWGQLILNVETVGSSKKVSSRVLDHRKRLPFWKRHVFFTPRGGEIFFFLKTPLAPLAFSTPTSLKCRIFAKSLRWFFTGDFVRRGLSEAISRRVIVGNAPNSIMSLWRARLDLADLVEVWIVV